MLPCISPRGPFQGRDLRELQGADKVERLRPSGLFIAPHALPEIGEGLAYAAVQHFVRQQRMIRCSLEVTIGSRIAYDEPSKQTAPDNPA